jgi:hypothetical protein
MKTISKRKRNSIEERDLIEEPLTDLISSESTEYDADNDEPVVKRSRNGMPPTTAQSRKARTANLPTVPTKRPSPREEETPVQAQTQQSLENSTLSIKKPLSHKKLAALEKANKARLLKKLQREFGITSVSTTSRHDTLHQGNMIDLKHHIREAIVTGFAQLSTQPAKSSALEDDPKTTRQKKSPSLPISTQSAAVITPWAPSSYVSNIQPTSGQRLKVFY